jgi:hypothetical protein
MEHVNKGTPVFSAYIATNPELHSINEGVVSDIVVNGEQLVRYGDSLVPFGTRWRLSKAEAKQDARAALVRHIGRLQAVADKLADEILHDHLTTEEAAA